MLLTSTMVFCHHSRAGIHLNRLPFVHLSLSFFTISLFLHQCLTDYPTFSGLWCWCEINWCYKSLCDWRTWFRTYYWTDGNCSFINHCIWFCFIHFRLQSFSKLKNSGSRLLTDLNLGWEYSMETIFLFTSFWTSTLYRHWLPCEAEWCLEDKTQVRVRIWISSISYVRE